MVHLAFELGGGAALPLEVLQSGEVVVVGQVASELLGGAV
jgi:hypothetical protein